MNSNETSFSNQDCYIIYIKEVDNFDIILPETKKVIFKRIQNVLLKLISTIFERSCYNIV